MQLTSIAQKREENTNPLGPLNIHTPLPIQLARLGKALNASIETTKFCMAFILSSSLYKDLQYLWNIFYALFPLSNKQT